MDEENNFVNMLNETVSYKNWAWNEPNNKYAFPYDDVDCVVKDVLGFWYDAPCFWTLSALCSQIYTGKCSECQFKENGWLTNHQSISLKTRYYEFDSQ